LIQINPFARPLIRTFPQHLKDDPVDQPNNRTPFSAVLGPSKRQRGVTDTVEIMTAINQRDGCGEAISVTV
jgi:hypothetical protein